MPLPEYNEFGDLPEGVHSASFSEVIAHFGNGSDQRLEVTARLQRIFDLAIDTEALDCLVVFGSYVSNKPAPNDVDVILVMLDQFIPSSCSPDALMLFDHEKAANEFGASIFWIRLGMLFERSMEDFIAHWQIKLDGLKRGIVEIKV